MEEKDEELRLLEARVREMGERTAFEVRATAFLTPREAKYAEIFLRRTGEYARVRFFGGYDTAERVCLFFFPGYVPDMMGDAFASAPVGELLAQTECDCPIGAIRVRGSGYRVLSHRDYLGSLLSLGVEREIVGDILIETDFSAVILVLERMIPFLLSTWDKVANDAVRIERIPLPADGTVVRQTKPVSDTVASARLDCVVAALANLSREAAQSAIRDGRVEVAYECELRPDYNLTVPCVLSVRGVGKFRINEIGDPNRRGRLRLIAEKYI